MKRHLLPLGFIALLVLIFFGEAFWGGKAWFNAPSLYQYFPWRAHSPYGFSDVLNLDPIRQFLPHKIYLTQSFFRDRVFPLWNPYVLAGMPFFAMGTEGTLSPFNLLFALLDLPTALNFQLVLQYLLAGLFMYLLAYRFTQDRLAACWAGVVYILSGQFVTTMTFHTSVEDLTFAPLLLLLADRAVTRGDVRSYSWLGATLGLVFLAGMETLFSFVLLMVTAYLLYQLAGRRVPPQKLALRLGLVLAFFLGFSAIKLFPFLDHYLSSSRFTEALSETDIRVLTDLPGVEKTSLYALVSIIFPFESRIAYRATVGGSLYLGTLSPLLIFLFLPRPGRGSRLSFFLWAGAIGLLMAILSRYLLAALAHLPPLAPVLLTLKSYVGLRWLPLFSISLPLVLAHCLHRWRGSNPAQSPPHWRRVGAFVFLLAVAIGTPLRYLPGPETLGRVTSYFNLWIPGLSLLTALILLRLYWKGRLSFRPVAVGLLFVAAFELMAGNRGVHRPYPKGEFYPEIESIRFLKAGQDLFRVIAIRPGEPFLRLYSPIAEPNMWMAYGIQDLGGYRPIVPDRRMALFRLLEEPELLKDIDQYLTRIYNIFIFSPAVLESSLLDLFNVRYVILSPDHPEPKDLDRYRLRFSGEVQIYENTQVLPRAFAVHHSKVVREPAEILREMMSPGFDPRRHVILEEPVELQDPGVGSRSGPPPESKAALTRYSPNSLELVAQMEAPGFVFLSDGYHPGWRAWVDGRPAKILRANFDFRALALEKGRHRVVMEFRPRSFLYGSLTSLLALAALLTLIVAGRVRRRIGKP